MAKYAPLMTELRKLWIDVALVVVPVSGAPARSLTRSISMLAVYRLHGIVMARNKKVNKEATSGHDADFQGVPSPLAIRLPIRQQQRDQPNKR
eukprot:scaffold37651_cov17-Prasinocladus_malaysianus.AAC.2